MKKELNINPELDLVLERVVDVPPSLVWKAWTMPEHIVHWFTPAPWKTIDCKIDLRVGGGFSTTMQSPEGQNFPNTGCYLELVPNEKLVFTDALGPDFRPNGTGFFTAGITLQKEGNGTRYTVVARHVDADGRKKHEEMGFMHGWSTALDQLVAYMKKV